MQNFKRLIVALLVVVMAIVAIGPVAAQDDVPTYYGAWPYSVPPTGHFNTFSSGAMSFGIYWDLFEPPIAVLIWADNAYEGMLADTFGYDDDGNYVVTLKDGVSWSDGSAVSADDLVTTFMLFRLRGDAVWSTLTGVEKVDDLTVRFLMSQPSSLAERQILTTNVRANSVYGDFAARVAELVDGGMDSSSEEWQALLSELAEFRPEAAVSAGPFVLDPGSISDANVTFNLNSGGLNADVVRFERVVLWNGETEVVTPLVANEEAWYITHGLPPTTEQAFMDQGIDILRVGMFTGPGIYFNYSDPILSQAVVRQAVAMAINRQENGFVSLGDSGVAVELMTGMSDALADIWLSDAVIDSLNTYDYDPDAAAALLEGAGFSKGDDGVWVDADGNRLSFELIFPQEFADWSAAAENATEALNDFGIEVTARGIQFQQQEQEVLAGNFQLAIRNWGIGSPIPAESYFEPYRRYNGQGSAAGEAGAGMGFALDVTYSGGEINVYDVAIESTLGTDADAQAALVEQLAVSYNELLPAVPLWERFTNNALNRRFLDAPDFDAPIYINDTTADAWMPYLIMTGGIGPAM